MTYNENDKPSMEVLKGQVCAKDDQLPMADDPLPMAHVVQVPLGEEVGARAAAASTQPAPAPSVASSSSGSGSGDRYLLPPDSRANWDLVLLCLLTGWLGAHHFYMGRAKWGALYLLTFGGLGIGYVVDLFRLPLMMRERQERIKQGRVNAFVSTTYSPRVWDLYALWGLSPLGAQHFYLGRRRHAWAFVLTLGLLGVGWVTDLFRMRHLARPDYDHERPRLGEAYMYWMPFGLIGLHHWYLRRYKRFFLCFITLNFVGLGFVLDMFRMPELVREANHEYEQRRRTPCASCAPRA